MKTIIKNAFILTEEGFRKGSVSIKGKRISDVVFGKEIKPGRNEEVKVLNAKGRRLLPGMIDIHFHGMGRIDSGIFDEKKIEKLERKLLKNGVTGFLPTFYSLPFSALKKNLAFYRDYLSRRKGKTAILGLNLEGPFLNKKQGGAHDKRFLTGFHDKRYIQLVSEYRDIIRIITVSPELEGAARVIKLFSGWGIKVMLGHTLATFSEVRRSIDKGACGITHFYNRVTPFHHREVGVIGAAFLMKNVYAELIADGLHSSEQALQIALNNIEHKKIIFVSDRIVRPEKAYSLRGREGCRGFMDDEHKFVGGGSSLLSCVRYAVKNLSMCLEEAWPFISSNPAKMLGIDRQYGVIKKGKAADLLVLSNKGIMKGLFKSGEYICVE